MIQVQGDDSFCQNELIAAQQIGLINIKNLDTAGTS